MSDGRQQQQQQPTSNVNSSSHCNPDAQPSSAVEMHSVKPTVLVVQPDEEVTFTPQLTSKTDKTSSKDAGDCHQPKPSVAVASCLHIVRCKSACDQHERQRYIAMAEESCLPGGIMADRSQGCESSMPWQVCCGVEEDARDGSGAQQQAGDGQSSQRKPDH